MKAITRKSNFLLMAGIIVAAGMSFGSCSKHNNGGGGNTVTPLGGYVSSDSVASANLIAYFTFDNNVNDVKGNQSGTANHASYVTGIRGQAYQGQDTTSYATVPASSAFASLQSFSVSLWYSMPSSAKPQPNTSEPGGIFFVSGSNSQNDGNEIMIETDIPSANQLASDSVSIHHGFDNIGGVANSWENFTMVSFDTTTSTWVHVVMTYDGGSSTYVFYQNGNPISVSSAYGNSASTLLYDGPLPLGSGSPATQLQGNLSFAPDPPKTLYIGTWPPNLYGVSPSLGAKGGFKGAIDELRVFNRALSASEVAGLYLNGKAGR